jgi:uncharacterized protein YdeI (YjbR/CyaY-like superfamily)
VEPQFFATSVDLRRWFEENDDKATELIVGYYKKGSGRANVTWAESVDEALCFGWIDGIRRSIDDVSYSNRFTPRKPRSNWSAVNIARVAELTRLGRMRPAGLKAFEARGAESVYSYDQRQAARLEPEHERRFRANLRAWEYFQSRPAGYRNTVTHWVVSAKREETRDRRLQTLIEDCEQGRTVRQLTTPSRRQPS